MLEISKFIKENLPLCVCTLGLAIVGYLGYHAVCWVVKKCRRTEKVDQVAQKIIMKNPAAYPPASLINRVSDLEVSTDKITRGQGEYIVFHRLPSGEKKELSPETFELVYKILLQHAPLELIKNGSTKASEECANRYELIKAKLKEIDPTLETVFVPRTLYELIFIRKCIKEDLRHKEVCPLLDKITQGLIVNPAGMRHFKFENPEKQKDFFEDVQLTKNKRKCWHLCYFTDAGDNENAGVKNVAYRLNNTVLKALNPPNEGFTPQELSAFADKEIEFLKSHLKNCTQTLERVKQGEKVVEISSCNTPGPTTNFGYESTRGTIKPMGIRNDIDAQIIKNAIIAECSKIAQNSLLLYRGADFQKDSIFCWTDTGKVYSLSYGSSLFAGSVHDGGATAFHYMRDGQNAYAIPIPFDQLNNSPFYVPPTHPVAQLFGDGEIFHARTKAWKQFDLKKIGGMNIGVGYSIRDHLKSDLTRDEIVGQFTKCKNEAIQLK